MDNARILQLAIEALEEKRKAVDIEIAELSAQLEGGIQRSGIRIFRRTLQSMRRAARGARTTSRKGPQSTASRKAISERMKAYWAEKRKTKAAGAPASSARPKRRSQSEAARKAISEKMKAAWAKRKAETTEKAK